MCRDSFVTRATRIQLTGDSVDINHCNELYATRLRDLLFPGGLRGILLIIEYLVEVGNCIILCREITSNSKLVF